MVYKKINKIKRTLKYILILFTQIGCAASAQNDVSNLTAYHDSVAAKKIALSHFVQGKVDEMKDRYAEAILEYQDALRLDPSAGIHYALGKNYLRLNKLALAKKHAEKAVKQEPGNADYYFLLGRIYFVSNNPDSAEAIFKRIIAMDSTDIEAYFNLGQIYEANKPLEALEVYKKLLSVTGPEWTVLIKIADLNERLGKVDETIKTVEDLLELNPSSLNLQKILAEAYIKSGKYKKALKLINDAMRLYPDDLKIIELKGNVFVQQGDWAKGAGEYEKIIHEKNVPFQTKLKIAGMFLAQATKDSADLPLAKNLLEEINKDSSDWQVKAYLGEISLTEKNDSAAIEYFKQASKLAKWNANVWTRLGGLLFDKQKYKEAAEELSGVVKDFPENFPINLILGLSLSQINKSKQALPYLKKAVELNPNDLNANLAYAFALNQQKKEDDALVYLKKVITIDSTNVQALGMMGLIYDSKKMYPECDKMYEKALAIDSANALIQNNYAYSLSERGIQLERALKLVKSALKKEPKNSSYLDTMGWIYYQLGNYKKAEKFVAEAIKIDDKNSTQFDHLGDIYNKLNKKNKAVKMWQTAIELDSTNTSILNKIKASKS